MLIKVGTRGSKLAMAQTQNVIDLIKKKNPGVDIEMVVIKTKGDINQTLALNEFGDKGIFVSEIEDRLLRGEIDFAVHSMKDMPSDETEGLKFVTPPKMENPADVIVGKGRIKSVEDIARMRLGTGSNRRIYQLRNMSENIRCEHIRGNIDTRISKIESEGLDGVVLAYAGLKRLGYEDRISFILDPKEFLPAPNQGILALQIRDGDDRLGRLLESISDKNTGVILNAQRWLQRTVEATCHSPLGVYTEIVEDTLYMRAMLGNEDGSVLVYGELCGDVEESQVVAVKLGERLKELVDNEI